VALIEALVALLIMAFGMLALVGLQGNLRRSADLSKQRGEAIRLAQREMEGLRAYSVLAQADPGNPVPGVLAYAQITSAANANAGDANSNAVFSLTRTVIDSSLVRPEQKAVRVQVNWIDRAEGAQFVLIDSIIARADPGLSAALTQAPSSLTVLRPAGREVSIPTGAKDLGDGRSVFVPSSNDTVAWVFNNLSGVIQGKCTVAMGTVSSALTAADVAACSNNTWGYLLSGHVRFSFNSPPDSNQPLSSALTLDAGLVAGIAASAPSHECYDNSDQVVPALGSVVSYFCIVYPNNAVPRVWSGRLQLAGISLAAGDPSPRKICRYTADYDGNGSTSNAEHPMDYVNVGGALTRQNFLVINASQTCPVGHAVDPAAGYFSNTATVQHQP
jgi:hypothetical protein